MKFGPLLLLFILKGIALHGQVYATWPNRNFLSFTINPALATKAESVTFGLAHSRRWSHLSSSPTLSNLAALFPFENEKMVLGAQVFTDEVGPLAVTGVDLAYGYKIKTGWLSTDKFSVGLSFRLMQIRFDPEHLNSTIIDPLIAGIGGKYVAPPSVSIGVSYSTGDLDQNSPIQMMIALSVRRQLYYEGRFGSRSLDQGTHWHSMVGLEIRTSEDVTILPSFLTNDLSRATANSAFRMRTIHHKYGWVMMQYSKAGFLTTELGTELGLSRRGARMRVSASNGWYFGNLAGQLRSSVSLGLSFLP
jgi:type IX secretion system PorP/SprF family membrane protein